jgi:hypothetical protein
MTEADSALPFLSLVAEQIRILALSLRREMLLLGLFLLGVTAISMVQFAAASERVQAEPEMFVATVPLALLLPLAVWRGEPVFGRAFLWTLPVSRQRAILAKLVAGAFWLGAGMAFFWLWAMAIALATSGGAGIDEIRYVGSASAEAGLAKVHWITPTWEWFVPFSAAVCAYALASALVIGLRHPWRWIAAFLFAIMLVFGSADNAPAGNSAAQAAEAFRDAVLFGRLGLDWALSAGNWSLPYHDASYGAGSVAWRELPSAGRWISATLFWGGAIFAALTLAVARHRER